MIEFQATAARSLSNYDSNYDRRFRCEDNNVAFTNVQPHYHRVRQVEPCYHLG